MRFTLNSGVELQSNLDVEVSTKNRQNLRKATATALEVSELSFSSQGGGLLSAHQRRAGRRATVMLGGRPLPS